MRHFTGLAIILSLSLLVSSCAAGGYSPAKTITKVVAAYNSAADGKTRADYVCDGKNDAGKIQEAVDALPAQGGNIKLLEGDFVIPGPNGIQITRDNVVISGAGKTTRLRLTDKINADASIFTASDRKGIVLQDFFLDGNQTNQASGYQHGVDFNGVSGKIDVWADYFRGSEFRLVDSSVAFKNRVIADLGDGYTLDDFQAGYSVLYGATAGYVDSDLARNSKSLRLTMTDLNCRVRKAFNQPLDLSSNNIQFELWLKVGSLVEGGEAVVLEMWFPDGSRQDFPIDVARSLITRQGKWTGFVLSKAGGEFEIADSRWASVSGIGLRVGNSRIGRLFDFGLVRAIPTPPEGIFTYSVDDSHSETFDHDYPILSKYGYKQSLETLASRVGLTNPPGLTIEQLKTLGDAGWDIAAHGVDHTSPNAYCEAELRWALKAIREWIHANVGDYPGDVYYAAPNNALNTIVATAAVEEGYRLIRSMPPSGHYPYETIPVSNPASYRNFDWAPMSVYPKKVAIDRAVRYKAWLVAYMHGYVEEEVVDYIHASGLKVMTMSEVDEKYILKAKVPHHGLETVPAKDTFTRVRAASIEGVQSFIPADSTERTSFVAQPDYPRQIDYSLRNNTGAASSGKATTITVKGKDARGYDIEMKLSFSADDLKNLANGQVVTKWGYFAFARITSVKSDTAQPPGWKFAVGTRNVFGMTKYIYNVTRIVRNGQDIAFDFDTDMRHKTSAWYHYVAVDVANGDDVVVYYQTYK